MLRIYQHSITIQTFSDDKSGGIFPTIKSGLAADLEPWAYEENLKGAGIFVSVNGMQKNKRDAKSVTDVRSYYCEIDGMTVRSEAQKNHMISLLLRSKLPPSAIVKSKNGLHCYWYAKPFEAPDAERYARINMGIIQHFKADERVKDIARVLRLPNFVHVKDPQNPYLIEVAYEDPKHLMTGEEIIRAYPYKEPRKERSNRVYEFSGDSSSVWGVVCDALASWPESKGSKHGVLMQALGVAKKFGISEGQAVSDLLPIMDSWQTDNADNLSVLEKNARWAFSVGDDCTVSGLRRLGVDVPPLAGPAGVLSEPKDFSKGQNHENV